MRFCIQQSQKALQTSAENFERYSSKRSPNPFSALLEETETHEHSTPALAIHDREHNVVLQRSSARIRSKKGRKKDEFPAAWFCKKKKTGIRIAFSRHLKCRNTTKEKNSESRFDGRADKCRARRAGEEKESTGNCFEGKNTL